MMIVFVEEPSALAHAKERVQAPEQSMLVRKSMS